MTIRRILVWILFPLLSIGLLAYCLAVRPTPVEIRVTDASCTPETETHSFPPDLNTAGKEALMNLPGVGEKTAQAIIDYRTAYGPFEELQELILVPGIGEKKLSDILSCYETTDK